MHFLIHSFTYGLIYEMGTSLVQASKRILRVDTVDLEKGRPTCSKAQPSPNKVFGVALYQPMGKAKGESLALFLPDTVIYVSARLSVLNSPSIERVCSRLFRYIYVRY